MSEAEAALATILVFTVLTCVIFENDPSRLASDQRLNVGYINNDKE